MNEQPVGRRPRVERDRFQIRLNPGDKLACSFVPQDDEAASIKETAAFLRELDALATRHEYKLETMGRLDLFVALKGLSVGDDRPIPCPGEKYRDFRGEEYTVLAVSNQSRDFSNYMAGIRKGVGLPEIQDIAWHALHAETTEAVTVEWKKDFDFIVTSGSKKIQEALVIYYADNNVAWARSLEDFLGTINSDEGTCYYRFEKIG